jgi:general secretion pathway protein K
VRRAGEAGYALVAAVASIGVFAAMALTVLAATRMPLADVTAEQSALQAAGAADAGIALALQGLLARDIGERWSIDGREHDLGFGDARLRIRVEDDRGKVPINMLNEAELTRLLEAVGLSGERLEIARDSLLDWRDEDDLTRPHGAERTAYAQRGIRPANGFLSTIDELGAVRGFDAATVARIKAIATTNSGVRTFFDPRYADPRALAVMDRGGVGGPAAIARNRERAGQQTALGFSDTVRLTGRPLSIRVEARLPDGGRAERTALVELTGVADSPYRIRSYD